MLYFYSVSGSNKIIRYYADPYQARQHWYNQKLEICVRAYEIFMFEDRLTEAETRETQSREEGEKAKADLFQVQHQPAKLTFSYPVLMKTLLFMSLSIQFCLGIARLLGLAAFGVVGTVPTESCTY